MTRALHLALQQSRALRATLLVLLAMALSWQSFVTLTHRHVAPAPTVSTQGASAGSHLAPTHRPQPLDSSDCPLCQEIAHSGAYIAPAPAVLAPPAEPATWVEPVPTLPALASRQRSHDWQSRAPPRSI